MADISITSKDGRLAVEAPYHPDFIAQARALGGRWDRDWDRDSQRWNFDAREEEPVRGLCRAVYGTDGTQTDLVEVRARFPGGLTAERAPIYLLGREAVSATGRDSGARLGEGVVLEEGSAGSGGSVKYWQTRLSKGAVLRLHDVPRSLVDAHDDKKIVLETVDDRKPGVISGHMSEVASRAALVAERARLTARIEAIDAELGVAQAGQTPAVEQPSAERAPEEQQAGLRLKYELRPIPAGAANGASAKDRARKIAKAEFVAETLGLVHPSQGSEKQLGYVAQRFTIGLCDERSVALARAVEALPEDRQKALRETLSVRSQVAGWWIGRSEPEALGDEVRRIAGPLEIPGRGAEPGQHDPGEDAPHPGRGAEPGQHDSGEDGPARGRIPENTVSVYDAQGETITEGLESPLVSDKAAQIAVGIADDRAAPVHLAWGGKDCFIEVEPGDDARQVSNTAIEAMGGNIYEARGMLPRPNDAAAPSSGTTLPRSEGGRYAELDDAALRKAGRAAGNATYQARRDLKDMPAGDSGRAAAAAKLDAATASRKEIAAEARARGIKLSPARGRAKEQGAER